MQLDTCSQYSNSQAVLTITDGSIAAATADSLCNGITFDDSEVFYDFSMPSISDACTYGDSDWVVWLTSEPAHDSNKFSVTIDVESN